MERLVDYSGKDATLLHPSSYDIGDDKRKPPTFSQKSPTFLWKCRTFFCAVFVFSFRVENGPDFSFLCEGCESKKCKSPGMRARVTRA